MTNISETRKDLAIAIINSGLFQNIKLSTKDVSNFLEEDIPEDMPTEYEAFRMSSKLFAMMVDTYVEDLMQQLELK